MQITGSPAGQSRTASDSGVPIKVYVHLFNGLDVDSYKQRYLDGLEPDESPYGFHLAGRLGFDVRFSKDHHDSNAYLAAKLAKKIFGFDLLHAVMNKKALSDADVVWTMTEGEALAVALLQAVRAIPRRPIIANIVWLLNSWDRFSWIRQSYYRFLIRRISIVTVHSKECVATGKVALPNVPLKLMYFGVNTNVFSLTPPQVLTKGDLIKIYSAGSDQTRDWHTLFQAFGNDPRFHLTILCSRFENDVQKAYGNVTLLRSRKVADFVAAYEAADVVVVPMKTNIYSGITVALEAAALGKPIVSSRTGGVPTYFDDDEVVYAPPSRPSDLRQAVLEAMKDPRSSRAIKAQARFRQNDYSTFAMIQRYAEYTLELLQSIKVGNR